MTICTVGAKKYLSRNCTSCSAFPTYCSWCDTSLWSSNGFLRSNSSWQLSLDSGTLTLALFPHACLTSSHVCLALLTHVQSLPSGRFSSLRWRKIGPIIFKLCDHLNVCKNGLFFLLSDLVCLADERVLMLTRDNRKWAMMKLHNTLLGMYLTLLCIWPCQRTEQFCHVISTFTIMNFGRVRNNWNGMLKKSDCLHRIDPRNTGGWTWCHGCISGDPLDMSSSTCLIELHNRYNRCVHNCTCTVSALFSFFMQLIISENIQSTPGVYTWVDTPKW